MAERSLPWPAPSEEAKERHLRNYHVIKDKLNLVEWLDICQAVADLTDTRLGEILESCISERPYG